MSHILQGKGHEGWIKRKDISGRGKKKNRDRDRNDSEIIRKEAGHS